MAPFAAALALTLALLSPNVDANDSAALIIGGENDVRTFAEVELFGCTGANGKSLPVQEFPYPVTNPGASLTLDGQGILVCGGVSFGTRLTNQCWEWRPETNAWLEAPALTENKFRIVLGQTVDLDGSSDEQVLSMKLINGTI